MKSKMEEIREAWFSLNESWCWDAQLCRTFEYAGRRFIEAEDDYGDMRWLDYEAGKVIVFESELQAARWSRERILEDPELVNYGTDDEGYLLESIENRIAELEREG